LVPDDDISAGISADTEPSVSDEATEIGATYVDYPCSVAQERFWLLDRLEPGNASLNVAVRWRLIGQVSTPLLERAWLTIIERHEVLRTIFFEGAEGVVQRVLPASSFKLLEIDLRHLPEAQRQTEGDRIGVIEARAPFDLTTGPLVRATLLRLSEFESVILVTTHQIVSDGWSIGVMAREMGEIYQALSANRPLPLEPLALQYADYSMWHLEWMRTRGTAAEIAYWSQQLAGVQPFKVAADKPRPPVPTTNGEIVSILLPRSLTNRAQALSGTYGATLFATALAALTAVLHRYTASAEDILGTQVSDRDQVELEGMIGQFVNSLILRNNLSGNPRFFELIDRARNTISQALEHRHIPIEQLLSLVKGERDGSHSALISVNFIFQRTFIRNDDYGDFKLIDMPSLPAGAIYDLNFFMVERPDGWRFSCQYNTDQFESDTAPRLLRYVQRVLEAVVDAPELRLSELPLVDESELASSIAETTMPAPTLPASTLPAFLKYRSTSDATAVVFGERSLSYRQLEAEANRLAHQLIAHGVQPGMRIGVCLPRSIDFVVTLLAIHRTGSAFLTLDPSDPPIHVAQQAKVARVETIVTAAAGRRALVATPVPLIDLDSERELLPQLPTTAPELEIAASAVAYVTVASDVLPDSHCVQVDHRALLQRLESLRLALRIDATDVSMVVTNPAGPLVPFDYLLPLVAGGQVVIGAERDEADGRQLLHALQRHHITRMRAAPARWSSLIAAEWHGEPRLKAICSAELHDGWLKSQLIERSASVWHLVTAPDAVVAIAVQPLTGQDHTNAADHLLPGDCVRIVDPYGNRMPHGAVGMLQISGDATAIPPVRGPRCTIRAVTGGESNIAWHDTGWRGRLRSDGRIERLGRADATVLLPEGWIDLGVIVRMLKLHAGVADAAAALVPDPAQTFALTGFVVPTPAAYARRDLLGTELRAFLATLLPRAMVPNDVRTLTAIPYTASGAVDSRQLLRQGAARLPHPTNAASIQAAAIETRLAAIWREMLKLPSVDPMANFFELGGHSLLAARMLARVQAEFGRRIALASLFRAPSIRELAHLLEDHESRDFDFRQVVRLQTVGSRPALIGVNNTGIYYMLAKRLGPEQPFTSLQLFDPSVRHADMPTKLEEIAAGYVELIRRVQPKGPYHLMGWCVAGALAFEIARQLDGEGLEVGGLYLMDSWVPGYKRRLPKLRALISEYSLRWQFIVADWQRLHSKQLGWVAFLENRSIVKKVRQWLKRPGPNDWVPEAKTISPEDYDQWLLGYLQRVTEHYEPQVYRGKITLFRSYGEPTGWWFDRYAGWAPFAGGGVELHMIEGDHFTMFQEQGVSQTARIIAPMVGGQPS